MKKFLKILNSLVEKTKNALNFFLSKIQNMSILLSYTLTFLQLRILIERGGVGGDNLQFKLASNPIGRQPVAVVLCSTPSLQGPRALDLRNSDDLRMESSSDKQEAICFLASSKPLP